ncbi:SDR family oxidoreductase [Pseudomonas fluorescens group sp. PF-69]
MKRILIIGATSSIAAACAREWAKDEAEFFLVGRNLEKLSQVSADLRARGCKSVTNYTLDINDIEKHPAMLEECLSILKQIDIALIAHGTLPDQKKCEEDVSIALKELSNNAISTIALLTLLANHFEIQKCGALAVISSVAGDRGRPSNYLYGTAKAAVSTYCEGLRARLFKIGVSVTTVKPGFVESPMTTGLALPNILIAKPEKVAHQIVHAIEKKTNTLYTPRFWLFIMLIIKSLPSFIFKRANL